MQTKRNFCEKTVCLPVTPSEEKCWGLDYIWGGKGVIPYEIIRSYEDLDAVPPQTFFYKIESYSSLKNEIVSDEDYKNVKKFYRLLHLRKLSDLTEIYNVQETIILCKIFEIVWQKW